MIRSVFLPNERDDLPILIRNPECRARERFLRNAILLLNAQPRGQIAHIQLQRLLLRVLVRQRERNGLQRGIPRDLLLLQRVRTLRQVFDCLLYTSQKPRASPAAAPARPPRAAAI